MYKKELVKMNIDSNFRIPREEWGKLLNFVSLNLDTFKSAIEDGTLIPTVISNRTFCRIDDYILQVSVDESLEDNVLIFGE